MHTSVVFFVLLMLAAPLPQTQAATNIAYGRSWPRAVVVDPSRDAVYIDGVAGIYPTGGFSFGVINATSEEVEDVLGLPVVAGEMALDPRTGSVFVSGNDSVAEYRAGGASVEPIAVLKMSPFGIAFDNTTGYLLLTVGNKVFQLDPATGVLLRNATVGNSPEDLAVYAAKDEVFVANYLSASISVLRTSDLSLVTTIDLPIADYPSELALDSQRGILYATTDTGTVARISVTNDSLLGGIVVTPSAMNGTYALAVDQSRNILYVAAQPGTSIVAIDPTDGAALARYSVPSAAVELAVDQVTGELYVTDYHQVTVINPPSPPVQPTPPAATLATLAGIAIAVALAILWQLRSNGGKQDGSPSPQRTPPSWSLSSFLPPQDRR